MKTLFDYVKDNGKIRSQAEEKLKIAYDHFILARAVMSEEVLGESLMITRPPIQFEMSQKNTMSVKIPIYQFAEEQTSKTAQKYGYAFTTGELDEAISAFSEASDLLLKLAQNEKAIELLSTEIEKTRRRVNALENVMIPNYKDTIKYIQMKLDENERANITRLMKVKSFVMEKK